MDDRRKSRGIVVGYDGSAQSETAVRWAAAEARLRVVPLTVCHAWEVYLAGAPMAVPVADLHGMAQDVLNAGAELARKEADEVQAVLGRGAAASVLMEAAEDAELVVVGSRGHGGFADLVLGSTTAALAAHAPCPIVATREETGAGRDGFGAVVVGVDGSPASLAALELAFAEAHLHRAAVRAVLAWPAYAEAGTLPLVDIEGLRGLAGERLAALVAPLEERYPGVPVRTDVVTGAPREVLLDAAEGAGLLVVGTRGLGGFRGLLLGSVSHALLHHAPCAVAVAHAGADGGA
ncbi:universal stress protein [Spirillospora albida]|uniref:universal stress protein n=1 Tax=Spirillospora albida TaxID=58123 RepID=UPI0004BEC0F7|nr:universal stress protein [Spirillospora albida]